MHSHLKLSCQPKQTHQIFGALDDGFLVTLAGVEEVQQHEEVEVAIDLRQKRRQRGLGASEPNVAGTGRSLVSLHGHLQRKVIEVQSFYLYLLPGLDKAQQT